MKASRQCSTSKQLVATALLTTALLGCGGGPARVDAPRANPSEAGEQAISLYDTNGDGSLSGDELGACPGMLGNLDVYDRDSDGSVTADEVADRIRQVNGFRIGLAPIDTEVTLDGRPLEGLVIHLDPEPYWGDALLPAAGITDAAGNALPTVDPAELPEHMQRFRGIRFGTYKIRVEDPMGRVPAHYATEDSPLGKEIARDTVPGRFAIALVSKKR